MSRGLGVPCWPGFFVGAGRGGRSWQSMRRTPWRILGGFLRQCGSRRERGCDHACPGSGQHAAVVDERRPRRGTVPGGHRIMTDNKHVVLIHGAWSRGEQLALVRGAFEERGYTAHTPTLRHHELALNEGAAKIASLSLRDYTDDLVSFVNSLDSPPLLVGHSMGGLVAQLVAARTRHTGLVAACPGSVAGIFGTTPTNLRMSLPSFLQLRPWAKPVYPPTSEQFVSASGED
ncbi:MAG: hypothetical protein QOG79_6768 [Mycobacterium sp.]|nr:hypothetical protein [Mycobacterium sp.]